MKINNSYDNRLFKGGFRKYFHEKRFFWLYDQIKLMRKKKMISNPSIIEIGCFNCRSLDYLGFKPNKYYGLDAGWENGVQEAIKKYPEYKIKISKSSEDVIGNWDICLALETLEHLPRPNVLEEYLKKISTHSKILIATVPMEIGPLFLVKFLYKKFFHGYNHPHTFLEVLYQFFGRCDLVRQDNHCGFDFRKLSILIDKYFIIQKIEGINFKKPKIMNAQIGIIANSRFNFKK